MTESQLLSDCYHKSMENNTDTLMDIPELIAAIGERIAAAGGEVHIVGGWVRDRLRGVDCQDIDLATTLAPDRVKSAVEELGPVYDLGERFGTVGVQAGAYTVEITTFRRDRYSPGSRHPEVTPVASIEEDLSRRDFTINAMALPVAPEPGGLLDPFGGARDIERCLIRTPGSPGERMAEDPLRMMRAVRFAAQLGYQIDGELLSVLESEAGLLDSISWERRRDELERILVTDRADTGIRTLVNTGLMRYVSPELAAMDGVEQPPTYHRADVLEHTLLTMMYLPADPLLRRAALFHDVGKPPAKVTSPRTSFHDHESIGEELTRRAMRRLRYGNIDIRKTAFLVRRHMRPILYDSAWSDAAVRRMRRECALVKNDTVLVPVETVFELAAADIKAGSLEKAREGLARLSELKERVDRAGEEHPVEMSRSPLDGRELMELFGRKEGPWIRDIKAHLTGLVVDGELDPDDRKGAAVRAREFLENG